jgi:small subunit ribosomal protein S33
LGNKILRQRLKGPALASYYPRKMLTIQDLQNAYKDELEIFDDEEEDRFEKIKM